MPILWEDSLFWEKGILDDPNQRESAEADAKPGQRHPPRRRGICVSTAYPSRMRKACLWILLPCIGPIQMQKAKNGS